MVNMWTLRDIAADNHWLVVEDAAQCHGAKFRGHPPGFYSDAATFSFYPTKNLGAFGEGGAVVTRYPLVDERVRILRNGGRTSHSIHELRGFSSYLDDLQAAALQIKLKYLRSATQKRQACAARYQSALQGVGDITFPEMPEPGVDSTNVYHLFVIQTKRRAALIEYLDFMGIPSLIHYPSTVPMQPAFRDEYLGSNFPRAEYASRTVLSLPLWPDMTTKEQDKVIKAIKQVFSTKGP
jgi:dTDP-4-amino-4,6-dideoxygalactose transaminase